MTSKKNRQISQLLPFWSINATVTQSSVTLTPEQAHLHLMSLEFASIPQLWAVSPGSVCDRDSPRTCLRFTLKLWCVAFSRALTVKLSGSSLSLIWDSFSRDSSFVLMKDSTWCWVAPLLWKTPGPPAQAGAHVHPPSHWGSHRAPTAFPLQEKAPCIILPFCLWLSVPFPLSLSLQSPPAQLTDPQELPMGPLCPTFSFRRIPSWCPYRHPKH